MPSHLVPPDASPDELVANALAALGSPVRLKLLREIREPRTLREIEVRSATRSEAERLLSRQAVREHLDRLLEVGMVVTREAERGYGATQEYTVNHQAIYALGEEVRELARVRSLVEPSIATVAGAPARPVGAMGPTLVLAKGLDEGTSFALDSPPDTRREWIIGRRRGVHIALDYDPYISSENSIITWADGKHSIRDVAGSVNGTRVNFEPLSAGASRVLRHGDAIGVGRSLLLYWDRNP